MWRLKSRTNRLAVATAVLGVLQTADWSWLTPAARGILMIAIAIAAVLLREDTSRPIEGYRP